MWDFTTIANNRFATKEQMEHADENLTDHLTNVIYEMVVDLRKKK